MCEVTAEYLRSLGLYRRANKRYLLTASVNIAIVSTAELQAIKRDVYMSVCLSVRVCVARIPLVLETLIAPVIPPCGVTFTRLALRRLVLRQRNRVSHVLQPCSFSVVYLYWKLNAGSRAAKLTRFIAKSSILSCKIVLVFQLVRLREQLPPLYGFEHKLWFDFSNLQCDLS